MNSIESNTTNPISKFISFITGKKGIVIATMSITLLYFGIFVIFPIAVAFYGSFTTWEFSSGKFDYIGIDNYVNILSDSLFWESTVRTILFCGGIVLAITFLSIIIAVMINSLPAYKSIFRTVYFFPLITSVVAVSLLWKYFYDPTLGLFNFILHAVHLPELDWLKSEILVMPSIALMIIWKDIGYSIILFIAGLTGIPSTFIEAATIDGATPIQIFRKITVPLLRPVTLFVVTTNLITYMQTFTQIYTMTSIQGGGQAGGPGTSAYTLVFWLYQKGFILNRFGEASAISFLLFVIIMIFTAIQMRVNKTDWGY